jgi:hypothetical protein
MNADKMQPLTWKANDGDPASQHTLTVTPDRRGCSIDIDGRSILVLDLERGSVRVYVCNDVGEVDSPALTTIYL